MWPRVFWRFSCPIDRNLGLPGPLPTVHFTLPQTEHHGKTQNTPEGEAPKPGPREKTASTWQRVWVTGCCETHVGTLGPSVSRQEPPGSRKCPSEPRSPSLTVGPPLDPPARPGIHEQGTTGPGPGLPVSWGGWQNDSFCPHPPLHTLERGCELLSLLSGQSNPPSLFSSCPPC